MTTPTPAVRTAPPDPANRTYVHTLHLWAEHTPGLPVSRVVGMSCDDDEYPLRGWFCRMTADYDGVPDRTLVATVRVPAEAVQVLPGQGRVVVQDHDVLVPREDGREPPKLDPGAVRWYDQHGTWVYGQAQAVYTEVDLFVAAVAMHGGSRPEPRNGLAYPA